MLADRAKAMQRVCFDAEPSEADLELLGSRERWLVYRELVQNRLVAGDQRRPRSHQSGDRRRRRSVVPSLSG